MPCVNAEKAAYDCVFAKLARRWSSLHHLATFTAAYWARKLEVPIAVSRWRWPSVVDIIPVLEKKRWASCKFPWSFNISHLFFSITNFLPSEATFFYHIVSSSRLVAPDLSSAKHTWWISGDVTFNVFTFGVVPKA